MTVRRILPRVLASLGAVVLVASVPAWGLVNTSAGSTGGTPNEVAEPWLAPSDDSPVLTAAEEADGDTPLAETDSSSAAPSGGAPSSGGGAFDGNSGWVAFNGGRFWIGPPGSRSEVAATVNAYRASAGLPAFVPFENLGGWVCSVAAHGSAVAASEQSAETLGQRLIRRSPAAVGFRPAAGWAASATFVVDELILEGAGVYPNRATQMLVSHCAPPPPPPTGEPSPPPAEPPPAEPVPTETPAP